MRWVFNFIEENRDAGINEVAKEVQIKLKNELVDGLRDLFDVQFTEKQLRGFPSIKAAHWLDKAEEFVALIKRIVP